MLPIKSIWILVSFETVSDLYILTFRKKTYKIHKSQNLPMELFVLFQVTVTTERIYALLLHTSSHN